MENTENNWKLWVDTGGTFTDCLAVDPYQNLTRAKVLSTGALRGRIVAVLSEKEGTIQVNCNWTTQKDIFTGYQFKLLNSAHIPVQIIGSNLELGQLTLSSLPDRDSLKAADFEISATEEAPILAARLVTNTPLRQPLPPIEMRLGSTKGTNAILEKKGSKVIFMVTRGFRDLVKIGTQQRKDIFALHILQTEPLYTEVIEVDERIGSKGEVIRPLTESEVNRVIEFAKTKKAEAIAIAFPHSYLNPEHEMLLTKRLKEAGIKYISASAFLAPTIKILPRAETAITNAYLSVIIENYLQGVLQKLPEGSLKVMTSAGGLVDAQYYQPVDSLLSGPAGGVVGAAYIARLIGLYTGQAPKLLTLDMGGTSTDVSRYDQEFSYRYELQMGDTHLSVPSLAIETVAAGGGSLCYFDGHKLSVGPESAGANPGPACYGFGGPLALTDINLLMGKLKEDRFGIPIHKEAAQAAFRQLKDTLNASSKHPVSEEALLNGFISIANEKMVEAIRKLSVQKGYDPTAFSLLAFGGAGGQHACEVAQLLQMKQVIVPYDAGLLSAFGIGQAAIERMVTRQVIQPLHSVIGQLDMWIAEVSLEAKEKIRREGYSDEQISIRSRQIFLRFEGQEASLPIDYEKNVNLHEVFREKYKQLYGHWLAHRTIELESIKVTASVEGNLPELPEIHLNIYSPDPSDYSNCFLNGKWQEIPVFYWEDLQPGASIQGPALVISNNCSVTVENNWVFELDIFNNIIINYNEENQDVQTKRNSIEKPESVQLELFTNRFTAIAEEMGFLLERVAFSVNVKERLDFSCGILDPDGNLVVNAPHIPVHLGSLGICVRKVKEKLLLEPGDVVITNHPQYGGSHLPDITLIAPAFTDNQSLIGYVAIRAHHTEVGGTRPGSMPPDATSLAEEGVVIAPTYLLRKGEPRWHEIEQILMAGPYPTRAIRENMADLNGTLAAIQLGVSSLKELSQKFSLALVLKYQKALTQYARFSLTESLQKLKETVFKAQEFLDDGTPLSVRIQINNSEIMFDFTGSGPTHPANLNATPAIVNSAVIYVLRLLINKPIPLNEGIMESVRLIIPQGILNPDFTKNPEACPAVVGGNTETSQRLVDTLLKAFGLAACSQGTMNNLLFGNASFGYYETIGGGTGAGNGFHGASAVHQHMTNTRITDPEIFELRYPVRLDEFSIRMYSGGKGKWQGGEGIIRKITFLQPVSLTLLSQHRKELPYGLHGGEAGKKGEQKIIRHNGTEETMDGIDQKELLPGDRLILRTPGGGGYGTQKKD